MAKGKKTGSIKKKVRCYFGPVEWAKLQDVAAGNNMSESECFKKAGMAYIDNVIRVAMQRMEEEANRRAEAMGGTNDGDSNEAGADQPGSTVQEGETPEIQSEEPEQP